MLPFGARGGDPGVLRPLPFRASGAREDGPAADAGQGVARRPQPGPNGPKASNRPNRPAAAPAPALRGGHTGPEELPRRVRQASLVPQLREAPSRPGGDGRRITAAAAAPASGRSPEAARAALSAFQSGWARGRRPDDGRGNPDGRENPHGDRARTRADADPRRDTAPAPHHPSLPPQHTEGDRP
ncbi:hypothetical protein [Kitasatospora sp. NPDC090091]|uniref:hypothetical protein n=1 Tax=Kitasatospora sp. NPDC090091 TaxID=3364081 RepID=UPI003807F192